MEKLTPNQKKQNLVQSFSGIESWEDRYKKIIEMGKKLPPMDDKLKTEQNKIKGCQSQVWIYSEKKEDGNVYFTADSDALIVKGLVSLVLEIYSGAKPAEILMTSPDFIKSMGFETHLSPSRTNGLYAMIKEIILRAYQFQ